jgi:LCP family protein required for cell wall assembly
VKEKLWVPPPPSKKRRKPAKKGGGAAKVLKSAPARSTDRKASRLAAFIVGLGLLALCLMTTVVAPAFLSHGVGRTNILLLGIDRRDGTGWAYRTDTILVVTVDPASRAAGIFSIPRDLQVPIPGHGKDRINTANVRGSSEDDPDAGPALLRATIEGNFGIPIDGYLLIDFQTFVKIVDALGGVEIDVPKTLHDTRYPDPEPKDPYGYKTVHFDPGRQHMNGTQAIEYARSRMSTSDFDRAKRQQLILLALRKRALSPEGILRWPLLAAAVLEGVKTDLGLGGLVRFALLAVRIDPAHVQQVVLDHPLVISHRRADGAAVLLPNWDLINPVIEEMFGP